MSPQAGLQRQYQLHWRLEGRWAVVPAERSQPPLFPPLLLLVRAIPLSAQFPGPLHGPAPVPAPGKL